MSGGTSLTIRSAVPLRSSSPRIVSSGMTLQDDAGVLRQAVPVALERRQHDLVVDVVADEAIRARCRSGSVRSESPDVRRARSGMTSWIGKRAERFLQLELDACSRRAPSPTPASGRRPCTARRRPDRGSCRTCRRRPSAVSSWPSWNFTPLPQVRDVGERIGVVEPRREVGDDAEVVVDPHQRLKTSCDTRCDPSSVPTRGSRLFGAARMATVMTSAIDRGCLRAASDPVTTPNAQRRTPKAHEAAPTLSLGPWR